MEVELQQYGLYTCHILPLITEEKEIALPEESEFCGKADSSGFVIIGVDHCTLAGITEAQNCQILSCYSCKAPTLILWRSKKCSTHMENTH